MGLDGLTDMSVGKKDAWQNLPKEAVSQPELKAGEALQEIQQVDFFLTIQWQNQKPVSMLGKDSYFQLYISLISHCCEVEAGLQG